VPITQRVYLTYIQQTCHILQNTTNPNLYMINKKFAQRYQTLLTKLNLILHINLFKQSALPFCFLETNSTWAKLPESKLETNVKPPHSISIAVVKLYNEAFWIYIGCYYVLFALKKINLKLILKKHSTRLQSRLFVGIHTQTFLYYS